MENGFTQAYEVTGVRYEKDNKGVYDYSRIDTGFEYSPVKFDKLEDAKAYLLSQKNTLSIGDGYVLELVTRDEDGFHYDSEYIQEYGYHTQQILKNVSVIKEQNLPISWLSMDLRIPTDILNELFNTEIELPYLRDYQIQFIEELADKIEEMGDVKIEDMELVAR